MTFYILSGNIVEISTPGLGIPNITSADRINSTSGSVFSYTITATQSPFAFECDWLPYGLSINELTGVISGIVFPNSVGEYRITLKAANAIGVGSMVLTIEVPAINYLNTASTYAVLGHTTVTNTGFTVLTGDLGNVNASSITGFPPGTYSGTLHSGDVPAMTANTDATNAYNAFVALPGAIDLSGQVLGTGGTVPTLTPGIYKFSSSAQITGTLTLNAQGNTSAQWIFQI